MTPTPPLPQRGGAHFEDHFNAQHAALMLFMEENGRRPKPKAEDPAERTLAWWFQLERNKMRKGERTAIRMQMLTDAEKVWLQLPGMAPRVLAKDDLSSYTRRIMAFYEKHGQLPGCQNPDVKTDYAALRIVRSYYRHGKLSQAEMKALRRIPGALKVTRKDPLPRLAELQAWCAKHGRLPRIQFKRKTTPDEDIEAGLGQWMYRHVNRRHEPLETAETVHIRDSIIALQDAYPASGKVMEEVRAAAVIDFIEKNSRMPRVRREHQIYEHANTIRTRYRHGGAHRPATIRMLELTRELPSFLESQWDGDFDRVAEFVASFGRLPAAEKNPGRGRPTTECQLTRWLAQETGDNATVKDHIRQARLAALIAGLSLQAAA